MVDLALSSGYLAFAEQAGFLAGIEDLGLAVDGAVGVSSGALAGALWLAGLPAARIREELCATAPIARLHPHLRPWEGLLSLEPLRAHLARLLPPTFAELGRPFAVGVVDARKRFELVSSGPLPEAVVASCAVPWLFPAVRLAGGPRADGGVRDCTGVASWRERRGDTRVILHFVERTGGAEGEAPPVERVVRSPRSGASLFSLGDAGARFERTRAATRAALGDPISR